MNYDIFAENLKKHPHRIAIHTSDNKVYSYAEVDIIIKNIAVFLLQSGIKSGDYVGILHGNEYLHVFVNLALSYINCTYVPFDIKMPYNRIISGCDKISIKAMLVDAEMAKKHIFENAKCIILSDDFLKQRQADSLVINEYFLRSSIINPNPTYVVFSSGKDTQKLIPIDAEGDHYWANVIKSELKLDGTDRILCALNPAYDAGMWHYLLAFSSGSTLYVAKRNERLDSSFMYQYCMKHRITCMMLIASQLNVANLRETLTRLKESGIKHLMVTGDVCTPELKALCEEFDISLWNSYGPKELTYGLCFTRVNGLPLLEYQGKSVVPIGMPYGNQIKPHIIDGRLFVESPYLSKGYIGDKEATEEFFPIKEVDGRKVRVFDTGDDFSIQNGQLLFHNRSNHVKIQGVKVCPEEIARCLREYGHGIVESYVFVKTKAEKNRLYAYVVIEGEISTADFKDYLLQNLSREAIPFIARLEAMPRYEVSGKIDENADLSGKNLFAQQQSSSSNSSNNSEMVHFLLEICSDVLGLEPNMIGLDSDLSFLGADSHDFRELVERVKEKYIHFTYRHLVAHEVVTINNIISVLSGINAVNPERVDVKLLHTTTQISPDAFKRNIFVVPPLLGEGYFTYKNFAAWMATQDKTANRVYGLTDPGVYNSAYVAKSLEDAVDRYIEAIKSVQPAGPYNLSGFSFGTILAHAVASRLEQCGEVVNQIQLIDGFPVLYYQLLPIDDYIRMLESLTGFMLKLLNGKYYGENLIANSKNKQLACVLDGDNINLSKLLAGLDRTDKALHIKTLFDYLKSLTVNSVSNLMLNVAEAHLLFTIQEPPIRILKCRAQLFLSSREQPYALGIRALKLPISSPSYVSYLWDHYFNTVELSGYYPQWQHLDIVSNSNKRQKYFLTEPKLPDYFAEYREYPTLDVEVLFEEIDNYILVELHFLNQRGLEIVKKCVNEFRVIAQHKYRNCSIVFSSSGKREFLADLYSSSFDFKDSLDRQDCIKITFNLYTVTLLIKRDEALIPESGSSVFSIGIYSPCSYFKPFKYTSRIGDGNFSKDDKNFIDLMTSSHPALAIEVKSIVEKLLLIHPNKGVIYVKRYPALRTLLSKYSIADELNVAVEGLNTTVFFDINYHGIYYFTIKFICALSIDDMQKKLCDASSKINNPFYKKSNEISHHIDRHDNALLVRVKFAGYEDDLRTAIHKLTGFIMSGLNVVRQNIADRSNCNACFFKTAQRIKKDQQAKTAASSSNITTSTIHDRNHGLSP